MVHIIDLYIYYDMFPAITVKCPQEGTSFSNSHKGVLQVREVLSGGFLASLCRVPHLLELFSFLEMPKVS